MHCPAYESSIKPLRRDADDGVRNVIEPLCLADDLWIAFEAVPPKLIANYCDRVSVASYIFTGLEAATQHRMNPDRVEIIC